MKNTIRKLIALTLVCLSLFGLIPAASAASGKTIEYVATCVVVHDSEVLVDGYFVNHLSDTVYDFEDFDLSVYQYGEEVFSAYFGDLDNESIRPGGRLNYTFLIENAHDLNNGFFDCAAEDIEADFSCTYYIDSRA